MHDEVKLKRWGGGRGERTDTGLKRVGVVAASHVARGDEEYGCARLAYSNRYFNDFHSI